MARSASAGGSAAGHRSVARSRLNWLSGDCVRLSRHEAGPVRCGVGVPAGLVPVHLASIVLPCGDAGGAAAARSCGAAGAGGGLRGVPRVAGQGHAPGGGMDGVRAVIGTPGWRAPVRGCGARHLGACWTERFNRWSRPGAWVPAEYRPSYWYLLTPDGRAPLPCRRHAA